MGKAKAHSTAACLFPGTESSSFPTRRLRERKDFSPSEKEDLGYPASSQSDAHLQVSGALPDALRISMKGGTSLC